jgi:hypothetical protein
VLTEWQARRLAELAELRHRDGVRRWRGREAWRRLTRAGDRGDDAATEVVWKLWLRDLDDETWAYLDRWWPSALFARVLATVAHPRTAAETRVAIGEFCARHGVAPEDPVDRALFFVLTGQADRHRALDPDSALLTTGYRGMDEPARAVLRQAMVGTGDLGLVRAIAADRDSVPGDAEFDYLTRQFADAGEWPALWRLVLDASLPHAVAAMPRLDRWRPHDSADRHIFEQLAAVRPDTMAAAVDVLKQAHLARVTMPDSVRAVSFAPDRPELAAATETGLHVFAVPSGRRIAHIPTGSAPKRMVHLGERIVVVEVGTHGKAQLTEYSDGRRTVLWVNQRNDRYYTSVVGLGDRFVAAIGWDLLTGGGASRTVTRHRPNRSLAWPLPFVWAAEPVSGRIVVNEAGTRYLSILDEDLRVIARSRKDEWGLHAIVFTTPDRLITTDSRGWVRLWQRAGDRLCVERTVSMSRRQTYRAPCAFPARGHVVHSQDGRLTWLDADTLATVEPPRGLPDEPNPQLWSPTDGHTLAFDRGREIGLHDLLLADAADLVDRPVSGMGRGDLATVTAAERRDVPQEAAVLLALLRMCLEHRFGGDIALGTTTALRATEDDIALGGAG